VKYLLSYHVRKIQEIENGNDNGGKATVDGANAIFLLFYFLFIFLLAKGVFKSEIKGCTGQCTILTSVLHANCTKLIFL